MAKFLEECKHWISCIQTLKLDNINVTNIQNINQDAESNKYLFKVLLHLSHCADKCYKEKLSEESHMYKITHVICENLTHIPDKDKFFSALYFIICYLLNRQCFMEAKVISKFLLPKTVLDIENSQDSSKYYRLAGLWQTELFKKLETWSSKSASKKPKIDEDFIHFVNFHLRILKYCDEKYQYTFLTADAYVRKLAKIPLDTAFPCLAEIFENLSNYIKNLKKISLIEAYNMTIVIIGFAFIQRTDAKSNPSIINYFLQCDNYFSKTFASESQSEDCYNFFKMYCINFFDNYITKENIDTTRFKSVRVALKDLLIKYGAKNISLIQTASVVSFSFELLFSNWELLVSSQLANTTITYDDIIKMGSFVKYIHNILLNREYQWNYICKQCPEPSKCLVKKDLYYTSTATAAYVKIFTRANQETLNKKMFATAKEFLELLISAFNELEALGCKYASKLWEICGRLIFNIGLISENKYAAELQGLYEILCKQIIKYDGLKASISSFGLENPVGTSLHRLCNIYYNQEKYRQAMTYAAYNALLSVYELRKKKACDMWANIKLKSKDSKELQELTILKCLKTDVDIVKKLGIIINLNDYDLDDLCLKELKSLYLIKSNALSIMKQTITELESRNSVIKYAQGILLLCFHASKLNKREYISDYISKAIEKLKRKQKSSSNRCIQYQCLLANLSFFSIVEKLYVRSQVIDKQMEDANFTIKAFKTLKGNQVGDVEDVDDIIVPTYGGINIEEDNKLASEIRDVLTLWESCIQKDTMSIVGDGEAQLTLESIVICGEYCKLYKFSAIEEKSWKLAYKFAAAIRDFATCTYVTSRSLSLKCINDTWLSDAKIYIENIENSSKSADIDATTLFYLSLADFYLDCKKIDEAKVLLDKVKSIPNFNMVGNKLYIYLVDIQFRNYFTINSETSQEAYCQLIVELHYLLINSYESMSEDNIRFWNIRYHLISHELMFESLCSLVIPMYSLLSYRDVSLHLLLSLKCAQKLGISVRIAEFLKYLCYVDLLRLQIDSCETHIQDLEHVLCLYNFQASKRETLKQKNVDSLEQKVRDVPVSLPKNSASPELKKKPFTAPDFLEHTRFCQCFFCTNLHYQYLTFSCSHIQAQLFSLLKYTMEAERFFHGACKIKLKIDQNDTVESRQYRHYQWKRPQKYTVDYMMYLLDFNLFIVEFKPDQKDDALDLVDETQRIAAENDLSKHPITCYATELYAQHYVYEVLHSKLNIYVPQDITIDITNQQIENCITPKIPIEKITRNPRRRKSPPVITMPAIIISDQSDIENDSPVPSKSILDTAAESETELGKKSKRTSARNVRRKILTDELDESPALEEKEKKEPKIVRKKSTRKVVVNELNDNLAVIEKEKEPKLTKKSTRKLLVDELDENSAVKDKIKEKSKIESKRSIRLSKKSTG